MSDISFQITGKREELQRLVGTAGQFTTKETGSPTYLKSVYIEAGKKGVKAIGSSEHKAIELSSSEISVEVEGRILILSSWINTALGVIQPGEQVTLTQFDGTQIQLKSGKQEIDLDVTEIDEKMHIPDVGEYDTDSGITVDSEEFVSAFNTVSVATAKNDRFPLLTGVFVQVIRDKFVIFATNGSGVGSSQTIKADRIGDGEVETVMDAGLTLGISDLLKEGETITIHNAEDGTLHFIVKTKDVSIYHIRVSSVGGGGSEGYPVQKLAASNLNLIQQSTTSFEVDKLELLRLLDSAGQISSLDPAQSDGQRRTCHLTVSNESIHVNVKGKARYDESIPLITWASENNMNVDFDFFNGMYTQFIRLAPGREKISLRIIEAKGEPKAICLVNEDDIDDQEIGNIKDANFKFDISRLPKYFSLFMMSDGKYIEQG